MSCNSCNSSSYTLPRGTQGATGATGPQGPQGVPGANLVFSQAGSSTSANTYTTLATYTPNTVGNKADILIPGDEYFMEAFFTTNNPTSISGSQEVRVLLNGTIIAQADISTVVAGATISTGFATLLLKTRATRINSSAVRLEAITYGIPNALSILGIYIGPIQTGIGVFSTAATVSSLDSASSIVFQAKSDGTSIITLNSASVKLYTL